ncbi:MAG: alpha/beta hydrolase [Opitutae bacterium]|nr:alpha/beta hydrolase [Opitutae bacterium]
MSKPRLASVGWTIVAEPLFLRAMSEQLIEGARRRGVAVPPEPHTAAVLGELAASLFLHPLREGRRVPREEAYLETAQRLKVQTSAGELAVWQWGADGAPLVFLVHGWEGHGAQLGAFAAPLVAAGCRVRTFDAPGHGESPGDSTSVPHIARLLVELVAQSGGAVQALIGHSMGAAAAAMATRYGLKPHGLVLLAPPLSQLERTMRVAGRLGLAPAVRAEFFAAVERRTGARHEDADMLNLARRAACPMVAFHDPADTDCSFAEAERIVAAWRGARLVPCPGRGHYRLLATPEIVRQAVEFIRGLP